MGSDRSLQEREFAGHYPQAKEQGTPANHPVSGCSKVAGEWPGTHLLGAAFAPEGHALPQTGDRCRTSVTHMCFVSNPGDGASNMLTSILILMLAVAGAGLVAAILVNANTAAPESTELTPRRSTASRW